MQLVMILAKTIYISFRIQASINSQTRHMVTVAFYHKVEDLEDNIPLQQSHTWLIFKYENSWVRRDKAYAPLSWSAQPYIQQSSGVQLLELYSQANEALGDKRVPQVNSQPPMLPVMNDVPSDRRAPPFNLQQFPVAAGLQQKREREEECNDLSEARDSTKKIQKENGESLTQPSEGTKQTQPRSTKGSKQERIFSYILNFESITGNGGGDPDIEDIGNLSGAMLKKWYEAGWYELFNNWIGRLGEHPGLVWEEEFRSGMISDALEISSDASDTSDEEHKVKAKKAHSKALQRSTSSATEIKAKSVSKGVPAQCHKKKASQSSISIKAADFFSSNVEFLKATANTDGEQLKLLKKHKDREDKQHDFMVEKGRAEVALAEREARAKNAQEILTMDGMPDEVKDTAHQVLLDYFSIAARNINISHIILGIIRSNESFDDMILETRKTALQNAECMLDNDALRGQAFVEFTSTSFFIGWLPIDLRFSEWPEYIW
ncbi:uncharacterized protein EDB93DRAFT_1104975 [Suillus bovinus]|uniref:uncharacterized protein n=1 Tax=Suillus bovinus TaxID=48563 RepID=UPI001B87102C|nr:uncharacterized protein EDB93DRAFT_1104975 [Suillus bovinus]KAG2144415.1 hypothetical protein EDB93DRAFT_1104975 [Suillus bovinus]